MPRPFHGFGTVSNCNGRQRRLATELLSSLPIVRSREYLIIDSSGKNCDTEETTEGRDRVAKGHLECDSVAKGRLDRRPFGVSAWADNGRPCKAERDDTGFTGQAR
jgi:hypothetical protein